MRGTPPNLPFVDDARALALGVVDFTFEVDGEYALDLLACLEPIGSYDDLLPGSQEMQISGKTIRVIGLEDLIRIKRHLGRAPRSGFRAHPSLRDGMRET